MDGLAVRHSGIEARRVGYRVTVRDLAGHADHERGNAADQQGDLARRVARIEDYQEWRTVSGGDGVREGLGRNDDASMMFVNLVLEHHKVVVAVAREVDHMGAETGDTVEKIVSGSRRADIELDEVPVQCALDGCPDPLLFASNAKIALRRGRQHQHAQLLRSRTPRIAAAASRSASRMRSRSLSRSAACSRLAASSSLRRRRSASDASRCWACATLTCRVASSLPYAAARFCARAASLAEALAAEGVSGTYRFYFLSPADYKAFFDAVCAGAHAGFSPTLQTQLS